MKDHSSVSKAFSKSRKRSSPGIFFSAVYLIKLSMKGMFSPMNVPLIKPVLSKLWNNGFDATCYGFRCNLIIAFQQC